MNRQNHGRPLSPRIYEYVLAGLMLASAAGAVVGYHVYHGFVTEEIGQVRAYWGIGLPFAGVAAGVYLFAYGWQRGDVARALRMSAWLSFGAVATIASVLGVLALRGKGRPGVGVLGIGSRAGNRRADWHFGDSADDYGEGQSWSDDSLSSGYDDAEQRGPREITVHCRHRGDLFTPVPPEARGPSCGHSPIARAG